jgi:glycine/D-amino acid oxidase-like deaminating enzyme
MPILSNSLVTRPLTAAEIEATGFRTRQVITDTRTLRFYYRLLPDDRIQIGSRSAITGADATHPRHLQLLIGGLHHKFPPLRGIEIDYSWWGWVDVSHDMMPRIFRPHPQQNLFYALGYGGNGVSYSAQAGKRMAQMIAGQTFKGQDLPISSGTPIQAISPARTADAVSLVPSVRRSRLRSIDAVLMPDWPDLAAHQDDIATREAGAIRHA